MIRGGLPNPPSPPSAGRYRYSKRRWRLLFAAIDALGAPLGRRPRPISQTWRPAAIVLVQLDHLGDAVLTTAMLRPLAERFPGVPIDVLASRWNAEFWSAHPAVRQIHVAPRSWLGRMGPDRSAAVEAVRLGRLLRPLGYGLGIDVRGDFFVALALWIANIGRRLGWSCGGGGFLLTDRPAWVPGRHEVAARMALLEPLGIREDAPRLDVRPSRADRRRIGAMLAQAGLEPPRVVIHVGSGTPAKAWPAESWAAVAARLAGAHRCSVILVGDRGDRTIAQRVATLAGAARPCNLAGRLRLMELAALIETADVFLGADSGPAHLAAALGTPVVVLMSGTNHAGQWRPWSADCRVLAEPVACRPCHAKVCPLPDHPCMTGIGPQRVIAAALDRLGRPGPNRSARSAIDEAVQSLGAR